MLGLRALGYDIIFIDEYSTNEHCTHNYAWSNRSEEATVIKHSKGTNY